MREEIVVIMSETPFRSTCFIQNNLVYSSILFLFSGREDNFFFDLATTLNTPCCARCLWVGTCLFEIVFIRSCIDVLDMCQDIR